MSQLVRYHLDAGIATITLDDGKRNALSPEMFRQINAALDRAGKDRAIVIITGREETFSAGFDLKVLNSGGASALKMLREGYSLTARVLAHPYPVIAACNGHVLAMGVFLMLSADYVIGTEGDFKISANEVALGLTMPRVAAAMLHHRLRPADYQTAVTLSKYFSVADARQAGFFDEVTTAAKLPGLARERAAEFAKLDMPAHAASKQRIRHDLIRYIRRSIKLDLVDALKMGIKAASRKKSR